MGAFARLGGSVGWRARQSLQRRALIFGLRGLGMALALAASLAARAAAQTAPRATGDYVCAYGCRLTDANPSIAVNGAEADCMNEFGGLYRGKVLGPDTIACFRKTGRLSADGLTLTWSDGVIWRRHVPAGK